MTIDKYKHIVVSAIITVVLNLILPWWVAGLVTLSIGVGKEVYDKVSGKGCAEWKDLLADVIGILIGIL
jgi:putative lipoprotein